MDVSGGIVSVESRFDFTNIGDEVDLVWTLKEDGKAIETGTVSGTSLNISPLSKRSGDSI